MKCFWFLLTIFFVKSEVEITAAHSCKKESFFWTNELPTCNQNEYCLTLDEDRSHTTQFSTKTGYRIKESHDFERNDFEVESEFEIKWFLF